MELLKVKEAIAGVLKLDPEELTSETRFLEDLGADSLDLYQILIAVEEAFDIELSENDVKNINTVGDAYELIARTIGR